MKIITPLLLFVIISFIILFLYLIDTTPYKINDEQYHRSLYETFDTSLNDFIKTLMNETDITINKNIPKSCPNLLIHKDGYYLLFNTRKHTVPSVNPLRFNTLNEYTEFMRWLRSRGIRCPVLSLQKTSDGDYIDNPNVSFSDQVVSLPQWTLLYDAGHDSGSIPSFDSHNQYIGNVTPLDLVMKRGGNA